MKQEEHKLQVLMVKYWRYTCKPHQEWWLFAIPNGGSRDKVTGAKLKAEGVKAGVADLILAYPTGHTDRNIHGWWIEVKHGKNKLTMSQQKFKGRNEWRRTTASSPFVIWILGCAFF